MIQLATFKSAGFVNFPSSLPHALLFHFHPSAQFQPDKPPPLHRHQRIIRSLRYVIINMARGLKIRVPAKRADAPSKQPPTPTDDELSSIDSFDLTSPNVADDEEQIETNRGDERAAGRN
jgi:hypothetical protein